MHLRYARMSVCKFEGLRRTEGEYKTGNVHKDVVTGGRQFVSVQTELLRSGDTHIGIWMSFTKYPMNPITAKPMATALQICKNSGDTD